MEKYDLSYIFTVYNKAIFLDFLFKQLINLKKYPNLKREFLFIDDRSTDNSYQKLLEIKTKYQDFDIKIIQTEINSGPSIASNVGIKNAKGRYLFFHDADDFISEDAENIIWQEILQNDLDCIFMPYKRKSNFFFQKNKILFKANKLNNNFLKLLDLPKCASFVVKKTIIEQVKMFDERIFVQDVNIFLKLIIDSKKILYIRTPMIVEYNYLGAFESKNLARQHLCGFQAYYLFLEDYKNILSKKWQNKIIDKIISIGWKKIRSEKRMFKYFSLYFILYILPARVLIRKYLHNKAEQIFKT